MIYEVILLDYNVYVYEVMFVMLCNNVYYFFVLRER